MFLFFATLNRLFVILIQLRSKTHSVYVDLLSLIYCVCVCVYVCIYIYTYIMSSCFAHLPLFFTFM